MKLIFRKNDAGEISVAQKVADVEKEFSYVDMIKELIASKTMDEAEVVGEFTDAEKNSIKSMATHINRAIKAED